MRAAQTGEAPTKRGPTVPPAVRPGPVGSRQGPGGPVGTPWHAQGVRTSIVHRYGTVERPVEPRRVPSCQIRVPTETRPNPIWPDGTRQGSTDRSTLLYRCTIDVRTHTGPSGVPTGPPGPRRDPTGPRRTAGGTVGPRFIGASPVWAAHSSYWRSRGYLYFLSHQACLNWLEPEVGRCRSLRQMLIVHVEC